MSIIIYQELADPKWEGDIMAVSAYRKSSIKTETQKILFKRALYNHKQALLKVIRNYFQTFELPLNWDMTIEARNRKNREPQP